MSSRSWLIAIALLLLAASGVSGYVSYGLGSRDVYALIALPIYVLIYCWMKADARRLSVQPPPGAIPMIPWLLPIAIPYYLLGTRRNWRSVIAVGLAALSIGLACALVELGEY